MASHLKTRKLTKTQYQLIGRVLSKYSNGHFGVVESIVLDMVREFRAIDDNFNKERFMRDCNVYLGDK